MKLDDHWGLDSDEVIVEPVRLTPGLIGFISLLVMPSLAAVGIYLGAWLVADEVYAAEDASGASSVQQTNSAFTTGHDQEIAGWKKALVGICPVH